MWFEKALYRLVRPVFRRWRDARYGYTRLVEVVVYRDRLLHNLTVFQQQTPGCAVAPVLKSNAYGHGLVEVARVFDRPDVPFLVVDGYYEALILRNEGIRVPILVIGYTPLENVAACTLRDVAFTILDPVQLRDLAAHLAAPRRVHLKVDTGMHRQGVPFAAIAEAFRIVRSNPNLVLEGLCSHLADADGPDETFTLRQIARWNDVAAAGRAAFPGLRHLHLAATAGSAYADRIDANAARVGLGLYGLTTNPRQHLDLRPALAVQARVSAVKHLAPGDAVGYGCTFTADRDLTLAVVPTGYNSCVDRRLSNKGVFTMRGIPCPIVGTVSMNITTIDVTAAGPVHPGEPVTVISAEPDAPNTVARLAACCGTIPYEILVHVSPQLKRKVE